MQPANAAPQVLRRGQEEHRHVLRSLMCSRIGRAAGPVFLIPALAQHRSGNAVIMGRWSPTYAVILGALLIITMVLAAFSIRAWIQRNGSRGERRLRASTVWLDAAIVAFGAAYLLETLRDPSDAARLLDLNLLGTYTAEATVVGWVACVCLTVAAFLYTWRVWLRFSGPALMIGALLATLLALEAIARGLAIIDPEVQGFPTIRSLVWERRYVQLNSAGYRDREHALTPHPGSRRLLMIGDSFAFGAGLNHLDERLGEQLANAASRESGMEWEVITHARQDTHTRDHVGFLEEGLKFSPDVVVLLYVFNDIDYLAPLTTRTVLSEHPTSLLDRLHPLRLLLTNSFLAQEAYARLRHIGVASRSRTSDAYSDSALVAAHLEDLAAFGRLAESGGARWAIVPFDASIVGAESNRLRYRTFVSALHDAKLPVWPLEDAFRGQRFEALRVSRLDGHPSALANRLAARTILPWLLEADAP